MAIRKQKNKIYKPNSLRLSHSSVLRFGVCVCAGERALARVLQSIQYYLKIVKRKRMHFRRSIPIHALNFAVNNT